MLLRFNDGLLSGGWDTAAVASSAGIAPIRGVGESAPRSAPATSSSACGRRFRRIHRRVARQRCLVDWYHELHGHVARIARCRGQRRGSCGGIGLDPRRRRPQGGGGGRRRVLWNGGWCVDEVDHRRVVLSLAGYDDVLQCRHHGPHLRQLCGDGGVRGLYDGWVGSGVCLADGSIFGECFERRRTLD